MNECYIRGSTIKYLRIPDEVIDLVKEDVQKMRRGGDMNKQGGNRQGGNQQNRNFGNNKNNQNRNQHNNQNRPQHSRNNNNKP